MKNNPDVNPTYRENENYKEETPPSKPIYTDGGDVTVIKDDENHFEEASESLKVNDEHIEQILGYLREQKTEEAIKYATEVAGDVEKAREWASYVAKWSKGTETSLKRIKQELEDQNERQKNVANLLDNKGLTEEEKTAMDDFQEYVDQRQS